MSSGLVEPITEAGRRELFLIYNNPKLKIIRLEPAMNEIAEYEGVQGRICKLLGQGIEAHRVASAVGVDASYISQLLSDDAFKERVQELKLANLTESTERDRRYDKLEDKLLAKIEQDVDNNPLAFKSTTEKVRNLVAINGLKRRGANGDNMVNTVNNTVVQLMLPTQLMQRYIKDVNNQIVQAGDKNLLTMQSSQLEVISNEHVEQSISKNKQAGISFYE